MRVKVEFGDSAGRMDNEIHSTKIILTDDLRDLFRKLKKGYIKKWDLTDEADIDCLYEFSELDEDSGEFYIGMDEGPYIGGWQLV